MGESAGDEELAFVLFAQLDGDMFAEGRASFADINGDVQYPAFDDAHQFGLRGGMQLIVQTAKDPSARFGLVVLAEVDLEAQKSFKLVLTEGLDEIASFITVYGRLNDDDIGNICSYKIHRVTLPSFARLSRY